MQSKKQFWLPVLILAALLAMPFDGSCRTEKQPMEEELSVMEGPATIILDSLEQYYDAVDFDHAMHIEVAENDCAQCHHHTTGTPSVSRGRCDLCHKSGGEHKIVACRGCHVPNPFAIEVLQEKKDAALVFHKSKPGLKGAYHNFCISCHEETGGPATCDGCHARKEEGDKFFHSGSYAPPVKNTDKAASHGH